MTDKFAEVPVVHLFRHTPGEDDYDEKALETIVANFSGEGTPGQIKERLGEDLNNPVVLGHGEDQDILDKSGIPAAGWLSNVWRKGRDLFGKLVRVPQDAADAIDNKAYRHGSIEFYKNYKGLGPAVRRFALLGGEIPAKKTLGEIAVQTYSEGGLDFDRIHWYSEESSMTEEEIKALQEKAENLEKENKEFKETQAAKDEEVAATLADLETKLEEATKAPEGDEDKFSEMEKKIKALEALTEGQRGIITELHGSKIENEADKFAEEFVRSKNIQLVEGKAKIKEAFIKFQTDKFGEEEDRISVFREILDTLVTKNPTGPGASRMDANAGDASEIADKEYEAWSEKWQEMGEDPVSREDYDKMMK